jgi:hypothetical protein
MLYIVDPEFCFMRKFILSRPHPCNKADIKEKEKVGYDRIWLISPSEIDKTNQ